MPSDKYTIAWFKLAECVAKGEKEKAFGVYRLLMHSFDDQAYAYQLEGDLLGAFQDQRAIEKYAHAAQLYVQNNRFKEAAVLYRDLVGMAPDDQRYVMRLIEVYKKSKSAEVLILKLIKFAEHLIENKRPLHAMLVAQEVQILAHPQEAATLQVNCLVHLSKFNDDVAGFEEIIAGALESLTQQADAHQLQNLLSVLEQTNSAWYHHIKRLLKD